MNVNDPLSGAAGFTLVSATINEPDNGLGDGDTANDIQGWIYQKLKRCCNGSTPALQRFCNGRLLY